MIRIAFVVLVLVLTAACQQPLGPDQQWLEEGHFLAEEGKYEEAIEAYTKAIEINPTNVMIYTDRADAYFRTARYNEALFAAEQSERIARKFPQTDQALGRQVFGPESS